MLQHCFIQEIENNFICTPQDYRQNRKSTSIGHLENDEYYAHNCKSSMRNPAHKSVVNENRVQEARENMDQNVNENKT